MVSISSSFQGIEKVVQFNFIKKSCIVPYRAAQASVSTFLDVNRVIREGNFHRILDLYQKICYGIQNFEFESLSRIEELNKRLYEKLKKLSTEKKKVVESKYNLIFVRKIITNLVSRIFRELSDDEKIEHYHTTIATFIEKRRRKANLPQQTHQLLPAINQLLALRLPCAEDELNRLLQNSKLKDALDEIESSIKKEVRPWWYRWFAVRVSDLTISHKIAIAHSLELQEKLKDTHYVINHGNNNEMQVVFLLIAILRKTFDNEYYEYCGHFRDKSFFSQLKERDIKEYSELLSKKNSVIESELLAGDCYLKSIDDFESALSFFLIERIVSGSVGTVFGIEQIENILRKTLSHYFPDPLIREEVIELALTISREICHGGTLHSICIPKEKFKQMAYLSQPYGKPYEEGFFSKEELEEMQNGMPAPLQKGFKDSNSSGKIWTPQVRILIRKLQSEKDVFTIPHSTTDSKIIETAKVKLKAVVEQARTQFRVSSFRHKKSMYDHLKKLYNRLDGKPRGNPKDEGGVLATGYMIIGLIIATQNLATWGGILFSESLLLAHILLNLKPHEISNFREKV